LKTPPGPFTTAKIS